MRMRMMKKLLIFLAAVFLGTSGEDNHAPTVTFYAQSIVTPNGAIVVENTTPGVFMALVAPADRDDGPDGEVTCTVECTDDAQLQRSIGVSYSLVSGRVFDREKDDSITVTVRCEDGGTPPLHASNSITINVLDENDNTPLFSSSVYHVAVAANTPPGTELIRVTATDLDEGANANVTYSIPDSDGPIGNYVHVDADSGSITTRVMLDHEMTESLTVRVMARDGGRNPLHSYTEIQISVLDVDDNPPLFRQPSFNFGAVGNSEPGTQVGWVQAYDDDSPPFNQIRYRIEPDGEVEEENFTIDAEMGTIHMARVIDTEGEHHFKVTAYSPGNEAMQSTADVYVYVIIM